MTEEITANYPNVKVVETIYMDQFDDLKIQAAADELGVTKEQLAEWTVESSGQTPADEGEEAYVGRGAHETGRYSRCRGRDDRCGCGCPLYGKIPEPEGLFCGKCRCGFTGNGCF